MIITKTKKLLLVGAAILVIGAGVGTYAYTHRSEQSDTADKTADMIDYSPGTKADKSTSEASKDGPSAPATKEETPPAASTVSVQITGANVQSDNVHIGTMVGGTTTGTCTLTGTREGTTIQLGTSSVAQSVNSYGCGVYNISPKTFPSSGIWQLTLSVTSPDGSGKGTYDVTIP
jgi:hypothetical protein